MAEAKANCDRLEEYVQIGKRFCGNETGKQGMARQRTEPELGIGFCQHCLATITWSAHQTTPARMRVAQLSMATDGKKYQSPFLWLDLALGKLKPNRRLLGLVHTTRHELTKSVHL